ncbi:PREDICTED: uncharacterized protein LOC104608888 isoform X2 [Nelumbo nucifera]|uniref:Uncharacterized protein LOC104608888 isoform X2 n=1 Tax=Nelumbo nucifera TaxID=4432 RepID=A0A1U8AYE0_NELNU|nr:PREDICTED: uncharacterized protein LOC104608888 isoform X2 [Nelumbo nucifera]
MAGRRRCRRKSSSSSSPIPIGNCNVEIEGSDFVCKSSRNNLHISVSDTVKIKISVDNSRKCMAKKHCNELQHQDSEERVEREGGFSMGNYLFLLINPKDIDSRSKCLLQEVLGIYTKELPSMNYAANTGKESLFLEKCVLNGKYCTLLLKSNSSERSTEVVGAITYQIIPVDTQYAEIPVAAISSNYQHKGIGRLLYTELKRRLQSVGVRTIFCWADKESEGFWFKQSFVSVAEVDTKGKVRKVPIRADIRRALCFPGGSILMVSHINKDINLPANHSKQFELGFPLKPHAPSTSSFPVEMQEPVGIGELSNPMTNNCLEEAAALNQIGPQTKSQCQVLGNGGCLVDGSSSSDFVKNCMDVVLWDDCKNTTIAPEAAETGDGTDVKYCSCSRQGAKKRVWEASLSSLKSKKVKGGHHIGCHLDSNWELVSENGRGNDSSVGGYSLGTSVDKTLVEVNHKDALNCSSLASHVEESPLHIMPNEYNTSEKHQSKGECHRIMLMNIADEVKKMHLTKIIEGLGGVVTSDGRVSTHVVTGKARRTLNFCTALCSGAWIVSSSWLKASFKEGRFVDELPFILKDEEYELRYRMELKDAVHKGKTSRQSLLKGYDIYLAKHVQPPVDVLSIIIETAGGNVLCGLDKVNEPSRTIFVASEEDMDEELDLEAAQFAEPL